MVDEQTFLREVTEMERMLYRVSRSMLPSQYDCSDAVQEALAKAWAKREKVQPEWFRPWLMRILINQCHDQQRRKKRLVLLDEIQETAPREPAPNERLRQALEALPEQSRLLLTLHYLEGFSIAELASITHAAEGTVKSRLYKARAQLKAEWEADET